MPHRSVLKSVISSVIRCGIRCVIKFSVRRVNRSFIQKLVEIVTIKAF